jgi:hypothetical protein
MVDFYDHAKFRAHHFSHSGGVRVGKKAECSLGASLPPLKKVLAHLCSLLMVLGKMLGDKESIKAFKCSVPFFIHIFIKNY